MKIEWVMNYRIGTLGRSLMAFPGVVAALDSEATLAALRKGGSLRVGVMPDHASEISERLTRTIAGGPT